MVRIDILSAWGTCTDCGYQGKLEYRHLEGEVYDDPEALGVMLLQRCPACDTSEHSLVPVDYYRELVRSGEQEGE